MEEEDTNENKIVSSLNAVSNFEHVTPEQMAKEQQEGSDSQAGIPSSHSW